MGKAFTSEEIDLLVEWSQKLTGAYLYKKLSELSWRNYYNRHRLDINARHAPKVTQTARRTRQTTREAEARVATEESESLESLPARKRQRLEPPPPSRPAPAPTQQPERESSPAFAVVISPIAKAVEPVAEAVEPPAEPVKKPMTLRERMLANAARLKQQAERSPVTATAIQVEQRQPSPQDDSSDESDEHDEDLELFPETFAQAEEVTFSASEGEDEDENTQSQSFVDALETQRLSRRAQPASGARKDAIDPAMLKVLKGLAISRNVDFKLLKEWFFAASGDVEVVKAHCVAPDRRSQAQRDQIERGFWTAQDDQAVRSGDAQAKKAVEEARGKGSVARRKAWLKLHD